MESDIKDLLKNIVERLSKIETQQEDQLKKHSQTDQVIERLDTKQSLLLEKLSDVSTQLEQEKVFMRDQLKEAQDEILHRLTELQQQNVSTRSQAVSVGEEMKQLQATAGPNPVKETAKFCSQADGDVMDARFAKMSETLEQSVKAVTRTELVWLDSQIEQRISTFETAVFQQFSELSSQASELPEPNMKLVEAVKKENEDMVMDIKMDLSEEIREMAETLIKEIQTLKTNIEETSAISVSKQREDMRALYTELVTHVNNTSLELSGNIRTVKNEVTDHMKTVKKETVDEISIGTTKVKQEILESHNKVQQNLQSHVESNVQSSIEEVTFQIGTVRKDIMENTNSACYSLKEEVVTSRNEIVVNVREEITSAVMGSTQKVSDLLHKVIQQLITDVNMVYQNLRNEMSMLQESTVRESVEKIITDMEKVKRDLVSFVQGQCQITRDIMSRSSPQPFSMNFGYSRPKKYVCDFYIKNFRDLCSSGKTVTSLPWHINEIDSSVHGYVDFLLSGIMNVWLMYGRHPLELGLQPRSGVWLKVKATITDTSGRLPELVVGEETWEWNEQWIRCNRHGGNVIGEVRLSCADLLIMKYEPVEGYIIMNGALLVRYHIEVLDQQVRRTQVAVGGSYY